MLNKFGEETTRVLTDREIGSMPTFKIEGVDAPDEPGAFQSGAMRERSEAAISIAAMQKADGKREEAFAGMPTDEIRKRLEYARLDARARMMRDNPSHFQEEEFDSIFRELNRRRFIADDRTLAAFDVLDAGGKATGLSRLTDFLAFEDGLAKAKDVGEAQALLEEKFASPALKAWREAQKADGEEDDLFKMGKVYKSTSARARIAREYLDRNGRAWGDWVASIRDYVGTPNDWIEGWVDGRSKTTDELLSDRRAIREYEKTLIGDKMRLEAAKVMPFLSDAQRGIVNTYAAGGEVGRGVFKLMAPKDRELMYSLCQAVRPNWDGNWLMEMGARALMGVRSAWRGAHRADIGATDWTMNKGGELLFGRRDMWTTPEEREAIRREMLDDIHWAESVHDLKLKDPEGFVEKALYGFADSASLQYSMLGGEAMKRGGAALKGTWGGVALSAGGWALQGYATLSMIGEQFDNMLLHGVDIQQAGPLAVCGGLIDTWVERWDIKDWFGKNLTAAEMRRVGLRAGFRAALKMDGREFIRVCRTNFKQAVKIAGAEVREELVQGANKAGWCSLAEGRDIMDSFCSSDAYEQGMDAFWDALPSCTAFGVFGSANVTGSISRGAYSAYREHLSRISGEVARRMGIDNLDETGTHAALMAARNEAARIAQTIRDINAKRAEEGKAPMSAKERNAWINAQDDLSLAEKEFYAEHLDMYDAAVAQDGQAWADAHLSGSINEAMFAKAGWRFEHGEDGFVTGITTANGEHFAVDFKNRDATVADLSDEQVAAFIEEYNDKHPRDKLSGREDPRLAESVKSVAGFYSGGKITLFGTKADSGTLGHEGAHGIVDRLSQVGSAESRRAIKALAEILGGKVERGCLDRAADEAAAGEVVEPMTQAADVANALIQPDRIDLAAIGKNLVTAMRKAVGLGKGRVFLPVIRTAEGVEANPEEYLHDLIGRGLAALGRREELERRQREELKAARARHREDREAKRQRKIDMRRAERQAKARAQWESAEEKAREEAEFWEEIEREEDARIAAEEQAEIDRINAAYEAEFKLLADEEAANEKTRLAELDRQRKMEAKMLANRKSATKEMPRLWQAKHLDGEGAQRARAAYAAAWKAKTGNILKQEDIDALAETYGLPPEAVNLKKTKNGWKLSDTQILSIEALGRFNDGLVRLYRDISSVKIVVPDVVVATAEDAANAVPNEVYDPVSDTFVTGRVVIDPDAAKSLREQAGLTEPTVTPEQLKAAKENHPTRFSLSIGDDLSDPKKADEFISIFKNYQGATPPKMLRMSDPKSSYEWFKENLLGREFHIAGRVFKVNPGHYFRFVCETPKDGQRKGWIKKASSPGEARSMIERGDVSASDIAGYRSDRAASLPFALEMLSNPDAVMRRAFNRTFKDTIIKKFNTGSKVDDLAVFILNDDGRSLGLETVYRRVLNQNLLNGNNLIALSNEVVEESSAQKPASGGLSPKGNAGDTPLGYADIIPNAVVGNQPGNATRFSISNEHRAIWMHDTAEQVGKIVDAVIERQRQQGYALAREIARPTSPSAKTTRFSIGDRSAGNVAKFFLAREIMENKGRLPDARRADAVARALDYHGSVADLLRAAEAEAVKQTQLLRYLASDPKTEKVLSRAGLAIRNERAIERARAAAIQFSREVGEAAEGTRRATAHAVRAMRGEDYEQMVMREGLDFNAMLKAIRPADLAKAAADGEKEGKPADAEPPKLDDADRARIAEAAAKAIANGAEAVARVREAMKAKAVEEESGAGGAGDPNADRSDGDEGGDGEGGEEDARDDAVAAAVRDEIARAGLTLDSPEAMVQLVKAVTEKYIHDHPAEFAGVDQSDVWSSPVSRARFAGNLASFAQSVARAYAPSYARIRIASRSQMLNDKGLTTMRKIEEAGEALFRDLNRDIIRQSRASLIREIKKLVKPHAKHYAENELTQNRKGVESPLGRYCKFAYRVMRYSAKKCEERAAQLERELAGWVDVSDAEKERIREFADRKTELEMIDMFGNLRDRMPAELEALRDFVEQTINESRWEVMQYGEKWEKARSEAAERIKGGIVGDPRRNGVKPEDDEVGGLYSLIGMFETKARQLTRWATGAERDESLRAFSAVEEMIQRAEDTQYNYAQREKAKFVDLCRACYGSEAGAAKALSAEIDRSEWANLDRGDQHTAWTIGRVMQMYVSCVQADYADNCAKWGRDAAYVKHLEDLIGAMHPRHMDFIAGLRDIYAAQGEALSEVMQRTTGTMMLTPNRLYMPVKMFRDNSLAQKVRARAYSPFAPSLTPRVKNGLDFRQDTDIIDLWQERMSDAAHTIAWADTGSMVQGILQSDRVLRAIRDAHGDKVLGQWQRYVLDILAGAETGNVDSSNWGVAAMRFCARLASRTWLMLNPASWAKQLAAVPCFALSGDGNLRDVAKSVAFVALRPFSAAKVMRDLSETSAFKARYGVAISQEMKYATSSRSRFGSWIDRIVDKGMSGIMAFDKIGVYALAGAYHARRCELETQGKDAREASELAASWLMHIVDKTAQTTRTLNTTQLQRAGGAWGILLQFKSAPAQQTQFELEAVQEAIAHPGDAKRWKRAAVCILINHIIVPTITTAIESLLSIFTSWGIPDEEKRARLIEMWIANIVSGSLGSVVFLGTVAEGVGSLLGKVATGQGMNTYDLRNAVGRQIPAAEMLNLWINQGDKAIRAFAEITDGDILEGAEDMAFAIGAVIPGVSWISRKAKQALESYREKRE